MDTAALSDAEFLAAFEGGAIPGEDFHHRDHVRLAWLYLRREDFPAGAVAFCGRFRAYVRQIDAGRKYHQTITWFYLVTVQERMGLPDAPVTWHDFAGANRDLLEDPIGMVRRRYRLETLDRPESSRVFLLPDLPPPPHGAAVPAVGLRP